MEVAGLPSPLFSNLKNTSLVTFTFVTELDTSEPIQICCGRFIAQCAAERTVLGLIKVALQNIVPSVVVLWTTKGNLSVESYQLFTSPIFSLIIMEKRFSGKSNSKGKSFFIKEPLFSVN